MRKIYRLLLISALVAPTSAALAETTGPVPKCDSGAVNIEVYNKLYSDNCYSPTGRGKYCIVYFDFIIDRQSKISCFDPSKYILERNVNESFSLKNPKSKFEFTHTLGTIDKTGKTREVNLKFVYHNSHFSTNCAKVFDSDVRCEVTQTGPKDHRFYKVTIARVAP